MAKQEIRSPLPGTFYRKPAPDQPEFKAPGDPVAKGDVIGLVEVMKSFHEIRSDFEGTLAGFLVDNEDAVTPGQVLAEIES
ncbi:acetyl-CoA carboxylase [Nitratireductor sp. XY-223]|uniref:acetyl-CoA carboxylase n=1 Tax=Nitratireductor sp. XY-223 TaxID=2561926 RepID=UPI0010AA69E0|nr:acetyl-CoA carboxylase [Nitratireductor sp. XY-223]